MPDLALHRIRCSAMLEQSCGMLRMIPVDSRHVDMGFVRYELLSAFKDSEYESKAHAFQLNAAHDLLQVLTSAME